MSANVYLPPVTQIPSALEITAITKANPAVISVQAGANQTNTYREGQLVKLTIPFLYGMQQAANRQVKILSVSNNQITVDMDSRNYDTFSVPSEGTKPASMSPSGSKNLSLGNDTRQVPFQSYNNQGN